MKRLILPLFICLLSFCFVDNAKAVYTDSVVGTYEQELAKFPCDYQNKIKELHKIYPNAVFVAQNLFFDWSKYKEVPVKWNDMVKAEDNGTKSLIEASAPSNYRTTTCAQKNSNGVCSWYVASTAGVIYYLNPYNFLDEKHIFMFESQLYNSNQNEAGVEAILAGSFMANKPCPGSNGTYAKVILEAASKHGLSAYMLASRIKQENRTGTSGLVTGKYAGYEGYYNYFNIKASGSTDADVIRNGLEHAKNEGWTSPYLSILGGAKFLRTKYIGANDTYNVKGQMTNYLQKWDPYGPKYAGQQYMQNIRAPYYEAESVHKSYATVGNYKNLRYIFYVPLFDGAPNTTNNSCSGGSAGGDSSSSIMYGDLNNDKKIDKKDLLTVQSYIFGYSKLNENQSKAADVNRDGKVDKKDLLAIQSHVFGYSTIKQ